MCNFQLYVKSKNLKYCHTFELFKRENEKIIDSIN